MGSRESYAEGGIKVQLDQGVSHGVIAHRPPFDSKVFVFQAGEIPASYATHTAKKGTTGTKRSPASPKFRPERAQSPPAFWLLETNKNSIRS